MPRPARLVNTKLKPVHRQKRAANHQAPSPRPRRVRRSSSRRPLRQQLIIGLIAGAILFAITIIADHLFFQPKPHVLGDQTAPLPTSINQNFLDQVNQCFLPTTSAYDYHLYITMGFRTAEEQDRLYAQGRSTSGDIITNAPGGKSLHNFGYAVDVADRIDGYDIDWSKLQKIGAYCGLEQGDRGYVDLPHFQYRGGLTLTDFIRGKRPAPLTLPCPLMQTRYQSHKPLTKSDLKQCHAPTF